MAGRARAGRAGIGLGLSVVEAVASLHDGTLSLADSDPGLIATLKLPAVPAQDDFLHPTRTGLLGERTVGVARAEASENDVLSLNALVGFWLGYSAIFANPASNINNMSTAAVAITVVVLFGIVLPPGGDGALGDGVARLLLNILLAGISVLIPAM